MSESNFNVTSNLFNRAKRLFLRVLEQPVESRETFILEAVGDDQALCDEVLSLLNAADKTDIGIGDIVAEAAIEVGKDGVYFAEQEGEQPESRLKPVQPTRLKVARANTLGVPPQKST